MSEITIASITAMIIPSPKTLPTDVAEVRLSLAEIFFRVWADKFDFFTVKLFFVATTLDSSSFLVLITNCRFVFEHGQRHPVIGIILMNIM
jgi:hypothetical protein